MSNNLPSASEFSPSIISLKKVLEFAKTYSGREDEFKNVLYSTYFINNKTDEKNKRLLTNNCYYGMINYKLINKNVVLTELGEELYSVRNNEYEMYGILARHILLNLNGLIVINTVKDAHLRGEKVKLTELREWLGDRGINFPPAGKHASIMRLWLEKAGIVISKDWRINEDRLEEILGYSEVEIDELSVLTSEQRTFLKAFINIGNEKALSNKVKELAERFYKVKYDEKNLPKKVLYPLEKIGYINLIRNPSKAFEIIATPKLKNDVLYPLLENLEKDMNIHLRPFLRKPLTEIYEDVNSSDKYVKGLALEALAYNILKVLGLKYITTRLRGNVTGGAEVDLIFEEQRLGFSRWQVQCKNTKTVSLSDVAKEVGLVYQLHSNVIVFITTGKIGNEARNYASNVIRNSNLVIYFIDGEDLKIIKGDILKVVDVIDREVNENRRKKAIINEV